MLDDDDREYTQEEIDKLEECRKESDLSKTLRMISTLSYVVVLIICGIPIWYHTTKVYRASLPLEDMLLLEQYRPAPLSVLIHSATPSRSQLLSEEIQSLLGDTVNVTIHDQKIVLPISNNESDIEKAAKNMKTKIGEVLFIEWPKSQTSIVLTSRRIIYFKSDVSGYRLAMLLENWPGVELKTALSDPNEIDEKTKAMRTFPAAPKYDILISIINSEPQNLHVEWNVKKAVEEYLQPFINTISFQSNFTIKSQWLFLIDLEVKLKNLGDHHGLMEQLIPHIITPIEKKLSTHVSKDPVINLVLYVPSCRFAPVHIYGRNGLKVKGPVDAFISPRWGGMMIANPLCPNDTFIVDSLNHLIMSTFITHLHQLLGIPDLKSKTLDEVLQTGLSPSQWQKDYIIRSHTIEYLNTARQSLRSLAQLLSEISNIVIQDHIGETVWTSVDNIAKSEFYMENGQVEKAFIASQKALITAEQAFFDPSLLALLYFPDDQKYAVYIPLFLPVMIPVVISVGYLFKYFAPTGKEKKYMTVGIVITLSFISLFIPFDQIFRMLEEQHII